MKEEHLEMISQQLGIRFTEYYKTALYGEKAKTDNQVFNDNLELAVGTFILDNLELINNGQIDLDENGQLKLFHPDNIKDFEVMIMKTVHTIMVDNVNGQLIDMGRGDILVNNIENQFQEQFEQENL